MSTTPKQEDALQSAALSEQNRRDPASSVPLSQYLQTNVDPDDDGWTVYASNEEEKPPLDRPRDLSVLKSIKRFLAEESPRDVDASSPFDGSAYRVDYPFYDGEQSPPPQETAPVAYSFNEQITFKPDAVRYEKVEAAPDSHEHMEADSAERVDGDVSTAPEELNESEIVETMEAVAEEPRGVPETPARDESRANEEIALAPEEQPFVVEFGEFVEPAFDRLERGIDAPELPLIASFVKSRNRRETPSAQSQEQVFNEESFVVESDQPTSVRRDREPKSKMTIFRRFVSLLGKKEEKESLPCDAPATSSEPVERSDGRSAADYGETVAFAVAPTFSDVETFCSHNYPLTPQ